MANQANDLEKLNQQELAKFVLDVMRRTALHYGIWFNETLHQLGLEEALRVEEEVFARLSPIFINRLGEVMGFKVENGLPAALVGMSKEKQLALIDAMCVNWLASDGVWFQAVENNHEMYTGKRVNDTCWTRFSPLEARMIKTFLNIPEQGGLDGLEQALNFRLYARVNKQAIERTDKGIIYKMLACRVQDARKRKGLDDYGCKSAGVVEYTEFARTIDSRIKTECIVCPPDKHANDWWCAWRFYITE